MNNASVELYRFVEGDGSQVYTLTSAATEQLFEDDVYSPAIIGRDSIESKGELSKEQLTLSFNIDDPRARRWFGATADIALYVTLYSKDGADVTFDWKGRLSAIQPTKDELKFVFESVFTTLRSPGLRQRYQLTCNATLYGPRCGVFREDFRNNGSVTNLVGLRVTVPEAASFENGYFTSGMFADHEGSLRFITKHNGDKIFIARPLPAMAAYIAENGYSGLSCGLYPGCNKTAARCNTVFDNLLNFRGFPFIPGINPFDGSSLV